MRITRAVLAVVTCLLLAGGASAQIDNSQVQRFDRQLETLRRNTRLRADPNVPFSQRTYFDYGAYTAFTYLSVDDPSLENTGMRQYELGAYANLIFDGANEVFFRGRLFHRDFNPGDRFNSDGTDLDGRVDRLFYRFDLARYQAAYQGTQSPGNVTVKLGRDLVLWGNGLTLSTDVDAAVIDLSYDAFNLQLLAGVTPLDTVDFDAARPRFDSHTKRGFYGGLGSVRAGSHRLYAYGLSQQDYNTDDLDSDDTINGSAAIPTTFHYRSYYIGIGATGALTDRLSYGVEAVYEGGHTRSSSFTVNDDGSATVVDQTVDEIEAYALDAQLNYVCPDIHMTRFSAQVLLASGDDDRISSTTSTYGGNSPGTEDNAFNAFGLPDVGVAFSPSVSNLIMLRAGVTSFPFNQYKPFRKLQIGADLYGFFKMDTDAVIDEPTTDHRWLGFEPDIYMNWQLTSDIALSVRYGAFIPGDAIVNDGKIRQFVFTGLTVAF